MYDLDGEDYPWLKVVFLPNGTEVTMGRWEKINASFLRRAIRAITRERGKLRKAIIRARRSEDA